MVVYKTAMMECLAKWKVRCQLLKCFDGKVIAKPPIPMGRNERYIVYIFRYLHTFGWIFYGFFMLVNIYIYKRPMGIRLWVPGVGSQEGVRFRVFTGAETPEPHKQLVGDAITGGVVGPGGRSGGCRAF